MFKPALILFTFCLLCSGIATSAFATNPGTTVELIDGRQVESLTIHHSTAKEVIVFENGSRSEIEKWGSVPGHLARSATVFAYNRPGYGNSEATSTSRDGRTIVEELRRVLRHKGLKPPYVLVGHSLGGLYMQLFAKRYPEEVKGVVLVDSLYPGMIKKTDDFPLLTRIAGQLAFSRTVWHEIERIDDTGEMILASSTINNKPIVRLVNQPVSKTAIAVDFGAFRMDKTTRDRVRSLYPKAETIVADSSHQMAVTSPELVIAAVRRVVSLADEKNQAPR